jgi:hypothetical protein
MLNVAIAVDTATDFGPEAVRVVAAACEEVIGAQRCPVAGDLEPGTVAAWYAVVHPSDSGLSSIRIEFRDRTADGVLIEERSLSFSAADSEMSRLTSAGSVIAALAAAREGSLVHPPRKNSAREVAANPSSATPSIRPPDWSVDMAALGVSAFGAGPYRLGGLGRVQGSLDPHLFGLVSARYTAHPGNPSFSWWTLSAGVGTPIGDSAATLHLELSGEFVFEHTSVVAEQGKVEDRAGRSGWGGRVGMSAVWATWRHCSMILGVDGTLVLPRINVTIGEQDAARVPLANAGLLLGLRFQP